MRVAAANQTRVRTIEIVGYTFFNVQFVPHKTSERKKNNNNNYNGQKLLIRFEWIACYTHIHLNYIPSHPAG